LYPLVRLESAAHRKGGEMRHIRLADLPVTEPAEGLRARFVHSDNMTLAFWEIDEGAVLPEHAHPHEQVVNPIEGDLELTVGEERMRLGPGDVVVVPPGVPHAGRAMTPCRVIDVFHPVREDYR
jgi:quercetin dioxygenase-like cupin family protein